MTIATKFWTWGEIKAKVERDLDLQGEVFISPEELLGYANEAVDEAEAEIHTIYEDYFLDKAALTFVTGTDEYSLPSKIYAHKIRRITYRNGTKVYTINRIKDWKKFEAYEIERVASASTEYAYFLLNQTAGSPKILLTPAAKEDGAYGTIWYLRQANRLVEDEDVCDLPEAINFILQHIKVRCYEKEGHPNLTKAVGDLETQRQIMVDTLTAMVPDADNEIEPDLSSYDEHN